MFKNIIITTSFVFSLGTVGNFYAMGSSSSVSRGDEQAREDALKSLKVSALNKAYKTSDESKVASINARMGTIAINDDKHKKQIIMQIGALPAGWQEPARDKLKYHERIEQWSEAPIELLESEHDKNSINNHSFPEMVDYIMQRFGNRGTYKNEKGRDNPRLTLPGRIKHTDTDESVSGEFEYTFFEDSNGKKTLFHRFFRPAKFNYKTLVYKK